MPSRNRILIIQAPIVYFPWCTVYRKAKELCSWPSRTFWVKFWRIWGFPKIRGTLGFRVFGMFRVEG